MLPRINLIYETFLFRDMMENFEDKIVEAARGWLGTKFHHQGRMKNVGVDCIGLIVGVAKELGIAVEDRNDYAREPRNGELEKALGANLSECEIAHGAVALFRIEKEPQHVGIISKYKNGLGLIHAYAQTRKVVEHSFDECWQKRLVKTFSLAGAGK
ncbi:MAG: peptidase P60 [Alphaproteobacteria bacterium CG11_big_fil_rev_8_21_14_0_20_44_7]|nr:MAG: peptidase P60 [Alphaproteobacteria bacterium CG11_big_fil_rev_8_21_14_0_20_44_7]